MCWSTRYLTYVMKIKDYVGLFFVTLLIILLFTALDYFTHGLSPEYSVPNYYFRNKIIFGTLIGFLALIFLNKINWGKRALLTSLIVSVLLQTKYYLEGYPKKFVFEFMLFHFLMLVVSSFIVFWILYRNKKVKFW